MTPSKDIVFMSIFYPQGKWHLLLREIRDILKRVQVAKHTERVLVFLNHHRGANVRIVFEFNSDSGETILKKISALIKHFILYNQGRQQPVKLPITGFFADCPTNEVYYNLFNEHVLRYEAAGTIQDHLSEIIIHFFTGTHVNDKTISTLTKYLHRYTLNTFLPNTKERLALISCFRRNSPIINLEKTKHESLFKRNPAIGKLLEKFGKATHKLFIENGDIESAFSEMMKIIQFQLGELSTQNFNKTLEPLK